MLREYSHTKVTSGKGGEINIQKYKVHFWFSEYHHFVYILYTYRSWNIFCCTHTKQIAPPSTWHLYKTCLQLA